MTNLRGLPLRYKALILFVIISMLVPAGLALASSAQAEDCFCDCEAGWTFLYRDESGVDGSFQSDQLIGMKIRIGLKAGSAQGNSGQEKDYWTVVGLDGSGTKYASTYVDLNGLKYIYRVNFLGGGAVSWETISGKQISHVDISYCDPGTPEETPTVTPTETPVETPTETPTETPVETPTETPVETPTETPVETPTETPVETPTETPVETPTETPVETPTETPVETPTETPVETPTETPVETPTPTDPPEETPTPTDPPTDPPGETPTETHNDPTTEPSGNPEAVAGADLVLPFLGPQPVEAVAPAAGGLGFNPLLLGGVGTALLGALRLAWSIIKRR